MTQLGRLCSRLLRTEEKDFRTLRNTTNHSPDLTFRSKKRKFFYYHFYYSGPHSNIDFDPYTWAQKNNFSVNKINHYPLVIKFNRNKTLGIENPLYLGLQDQTGAEFRTMWRLLTDELKLKRTRKLI